MKIDSMSKHTFEPYIEDFISHSLSTRGFEAIPLAGDASARRYCRIVQGQDSFVLMVWEPFKDDGKYPFLSVLRHFEKHSVHVPKVIDYEASKGLVLLEDLGDLTLERKFWENQDQNKVLPFYEQAIDELLKIHYDCTEDKSPCTAFDIEFDTKKLLWEMNYGREHLLQDFAGIELSSVESATLSKEFTSICQKLDEQPKRICHRDYHSRNLMLKLGNMRVIDFQDARLGPIQYDLVSLIHDSYVNLNADSEASILKYYIDRASEKTSHKISRDEFDEIYRVQLIQRCFKACGSFTSFYNLRKDQRYLKYIKGTLLKVVNTLKDYSEYSGFRSILVDHGLLDREYKVE